MAGAVERSGAMESVKEDTDKGDSPAYQVAPDLLCLTTMVANLCYLGPVEGTDDWFLVDTGIANYGGRIIAVAEERFGRDRPPKAIILTHGHFDHVGSLLEVLAHWDVPVYAHADELPYLTGKADYPPANMAAGVTLLTQLADLYPTNGMDVGDRARPLPADGSIPGLPEWRWIHTPGHTPGHICLFRERDRLMIVGDAFTAAKQEMVSGVVVEREGLQGPPPSFTINPQRAHRSVQELAALKPALVVTGHGRPIGGAVLNEQLKELAGNEALMIPSQQEG